MEKFKLNYDYTYPLMYDFYLKHLIFGMTNGNDVDVGKIIGTRKITKEVFNEYKNILGEDNTNFIGTHTMVYYYEPKEYGYTLLEKIILSPIQIIRYILLFVPLLGELVQKRMLQPEFLCIIPTRELIECKNEVGAVNIRSYNFDKTYEDDVFTDKTKNSIRLTFVSLEFINKRED